MSCLRIGRLGTSVVIEPRCNTRVDVTTRRGQTGTTLDLASAIRRGRRDFHGAGREQPASTQTWQGTREAGEGDEPDRQILWGRLGSWEARYCCSRTVGGGTTQHVARGRPTRGRRWDEKGAEGGRTAQRNQAEEAEATNRDEGGRSIWRGACLDVNGTTGLWMKQPWP